MKAPADIIMEWPAQVRAMEAIDAATERALDDLRDVLNRGTELEAQQAQASSMAIDGQRRVTREKFEQLREVLKQTVRNAINAGKVPRTDIPKLRAWGIMPQTLNGMRGMRGLGYYSTDAALFNSENTSGDGANANMATGTSLEPGGGGEAGLGVLPAIPFIAMAAAMAIAAVGIAYVITTAWEQHQSAKMEHQTRLIAVNAYVDEWKRRAGSSPTLPSMPVVVPDRSRTPATAAAASFGAAAGGGLVLIAALGAAFLFFRKRRA